MTVLGATDGDCGVRMPIVQCGADYMMVWALRTDGADNDVMVIL